MVGKFYLQRQKLFHEGKVSLIGFLGELKNKLTVERMACLLDNKPRKFAMWDKLYKVLGA